MSRDFEKEYLELAQSEVPDLWDRIEAGLSEKDLDEKSTQPEKKKESIVVLFRKYQTVAVALLCVAIIVPAVILMKQAGIFGVSDSENARASEMNAKGVAYADAAPAEEAVTEAMPEEMMEVSSAQTESVESEMAMEDFASDSKAAEKMKAEAAKEDSRSTDDILYNVQVQIIDEKVLDGAENSGEAGAVLTAIVLKADNRGELASGDEVTIFIPIYSSLYLPVGESFELNLRKEQSEEYGYTMAAFIERLEMQ